MHSAWHPPGCILHARSVTGAEELFLQAADWQPYPMQFARDFEELSRLYSHEFHMVDETERQEMTKARAKPPQAAGGAGITIDMEPVRGFEKHFHRRQSSFQASLNNWLAGK
jgi:hypothetical protein